MTIVKSSDYFTLDSLIGNKVIKAFPTKKDCQNYAKSINWIGYNVLKVSRRFETVWIVAQTSHQQVNIAGVYFEELRLPTGTYEYKNGSNQMVVVIVKKHVA